MPPSPPVKLIVVASGDPSRRQLDFVFEQAVPARRIWPVRDLVEQVRGILEQRYIDIWVEGEISNFKPAPSGHLYFTLKDTDAQLPVVLFRRQAMMLRFRPQDGMHVLVRGRVSVYGQRGQLQLIGTTMEPVGAGSLQLAFEQLKERLKAEGLFAPERKQRLPAFPRTVGIVTSPAGAVIRDFLNIVARRHSGLNVLIYPVSVQGESAPLEIEAALNGLNASGLVDLVVVARGGGSLEDLAAFNSERVARAIAGSRLPVVSAVGHETDFTIADFVADLRAPTPSAAAELITEAQHKVAERVQDRSARLERATRYILLGASRKLDSARAERAEWRMSNFLGRLNQRLDELSFAAESIVTGQLRSRQDRVGRLQEAVMRRDPRQLMAAWRERLALGRTRLDRALERALASAARRLHAIDAGLNALSPLAVLDRGYALVQTPEGTLIRSVLGLEPGQRILTRLSDGSIASRVDEIRARAGESIDSHQK
jgi:exodeoxyribonuclease VII large subunit